MALTIQVIPGTQYDDSIPVTRDELRKGANPSISIAGSISQTEIEEGAIQPHHVLPGAYWVVSATGDGQAYSGTTGQLASALVNGMFVWFIPDITNTGSVTFELDSLGYKSIKDTNGQELVAGALRANVPYLISYSSTNSEWVLQTWTPAQAPVPSGGTIEGLKMEIVNSDEAVEVSVDSAILPGTNGGFVRLGANTYTANPASSGLNGLDTGTEAADVNYYIYLVSNGITSGILLSTVNTQPSTTNYAWTYSMKIGVFRNDSSSKVEGVTWYYPEKTYVSKWIVSDFAPSSVTLHTNLECNSILEHVLLKNVGTTIIPADSVIERPYSEAAYAARIRYVESLTSKPTTVVVTLNPTFSFYVMDDTGAIIATRLNIYPNQLWHVRVVLKG